MAQDGRHILEQGDIFFLYRPDVEEHDPSGLGDVQRFLAVLRPEPGKLRLLVIGRKRLPEAHNNETNWGFVDSVSKDEAALERSLREQEYGTKTRGRREDPAARPAGEGVYAITLKDGQMHLAYSLELPEKPGEVQKAFRIRKEGVFVLSVKNPEKGSPRAAGLSQEGKADYPKKLQEEFRGRRFAGEDVRLLDHEGAEFILVGIGREPEDYDVDLDVEREDYEHADIVRALRMAKSRHPTRPLFEGRWA
jgi:hypothetical protein